MLTYHQRDPLPAMMPEQREQLAMPECKEEWLSTRSQRSDVLFSAHLYPPCGCERANDKSGRADDHIVEH
jgi:hypothetical protein